MSRMEFDAPEVETQRSGEIDLTDQGSQSVGSKRKAGRPVTNAWDTVGLTLILANQKEIGWVSASLVTAR